jgi:hypothetical protein
VLGRQQAAPGRETRASRVLSNQQEPRIVVGAPALTGYCWIGTELSMKIRSRAAAVARTPRSIQWRNRASGRSNGDWYTRPVDSSWKLEWSRTRRSIGSA